MASSSRMSCFHCQHTSSNLDHFRNGWRLHEGDYAQLCHRCAYLHEEGRFCETFHSNHDGWRNCESCGKLVHCGCIVSFNTHLLLDFGGIICMGCLRLNFLLTRKSYLSVEPEMKAGEPSLTPFAQASVETRLWPQVTHLDQQLSTGNPKSAVTLLFEKVLSVTDADLRIGRLIIPRGRAEEFLPDISGLPGQHIKIQDTEGNDWEFQYRYLLNDGNRVYILEGIRDFMILKKWQPGDTVTLYRVEPGAKLVMGIRKTSAGCLARSLH